jgi:hypothetical protein
VLLGDLGSDLRDPLCPLASVDVITESDHDGSVDRAMVGGSPALIAS